MIKKPSIFVFIVLILTFMPMAFSISMAQVVQDDIAQEISENIILRQPEVQIDQIPSLFFTADEAALIASVRNGITARQPTESELRNNGNLPAAGPRELALGGIVYSSASDWTIWLNGEKITPKRLPPEILDIKVKKDQISLKWFDAYTNQIFPIKLKPHQRFNIDTRIFLPG